MTFSRIKRNREIYKAFGILYNVLCNKIYNNKIAKFYRVTKINVLEDFLCLMMLS